MDPIPSVQAPASGAAGGDAGEHAHVIPQDACSAAKSRSRARPKTKPIKAASSTSRRGRGRGRAPAAARPTASPTAQPVARKRKWMSWADRVAATKVSRPCRECFREFSCGKALFGHMRWHRVPWWQGARKPSTGQKRTPSAALAVTPPPAPVAEGATAQGDQLADQVAAACRVHGKGKAAKKPKTSKQKKDQGSQGPVIKPVSAAVSADGPSSARGVRGCGIDLNLPPPEEPEEVAVPPPSSAIQKIDFRKLPAFHGFV